MMYYQENYEYDEKVRALTEEIAVLKKKIKVHSVLNSRELHVRRQEQNLKLLDTHVKGSLFDE